VLAEEFKVVAERAGGLGGVEVQDCHGDQCQGRAFHTVLGVSTETLLRQRGLKFQQNQLQQNQPAGLGGHEHRSIHRLDARRAGG
jgi:hypothetical protein